MLRIRTLFLDVHPKPKYHGIKHFQPNRTSRECSTCLANREQFITLSQLHPLQMAHAVWITMLLVLLLWTQFELSLKHLNHKSILLPLKLKLKKYFKGNFVQNGKSQGSRVTFHFVSRTRGLLNKTKRKRPLLFNIFFLLNSYIRKKIFIGTNYNGRQTMFNHVLYRSPGLAIVLMNNFSIGGKLSQTPSLKAKVFMAGRIVKHYTK